LDQAAPPPAPSQPAVPATFERGRDSVGTGSGGGGGGGGGVVLTRWTWSGPSSPRSAASSSSSTSTRSERLRNLTPGASPGLSQGSAGTPGTPGLRPGLVGSSRPSLHSTSTGAGPGWAAHSAATAPAASGGAARDHASATPTAPLGLSSSSV